MPGDPRDGLTVAVPLMARLRAGSIESARSSAVAIDSGVSGLTSFTGGIPRGGGVSPVSAVKHIAASCH